MAVATNPNLPHPHPLMRNLVRENQALTDDIEQTLTREGCQFDETTLKKKKASDAWDSNVITPGTPIQIALWVVISAQKMIQSITSLI